MRSRGSKARADELHQQVLVLARIDPPIGLDEIGRRLGISRAMASYYASREHRRAIKGNPKLPRKRPGRKARRRGLFYVAMRAEAVRAVHIAFPRMTPQEIAEALQFETGMVKYYLLRLKTDIARRPPWADLLLGGCEEIGKGNLDTAAFKFEQLARAIVTRPQP